MSFSESNRTRSPLIIKYFLAFLATFIGKLGGTKLWGKPQLWGQAPVPRDILLFEVLLSYLPMCYMKTPAINCYRSEIQTDLTTDQIGKTQHFMIKLITEEHWVSINFV